MAATLGEDVVTVNFRGEAVAFRYAGHITPAGNQRLTPRQIQRAGELADRIGRLREVPAAGLTIDPSIAGAANNWAGRLASDWHPFFDARNRRFEHLRLFCQPFTGFDPLTNQLSGVPPAAIPDDVDARLSSHANVSVAMMELLLDQRRLPAHLRVQLPVLFGESGPVCDGVIASYDAWSLQKQINGLEGSGILSRLGTREQATVVDIGSGFGGLAYQLERALAPARLRLVAIDLPDSLLFAAVYLTTLWGDRPTYLATLEGYVSTATWQPSDRLPPDFAAVFVVDYLADRVLRELAPIDLILNFRSMQEMSDAQVAHYGALARDTLGSHGLLYEQNEMSRAFDRDVKAILGGIMPFGGPLAETTPAHQPMGQASLWSNSPIDVSPA